MPMLAESVDAVIGVDTHTDTHTAFLVDGSGREVATVTVEASPGGYGDLIAWAVQQAPGAVSGGSCCGLQGGQVGGDGGGGGRGAGLGEDVQAEVAAAFGPFVVLFGQDGADEADQGIPVGEDADHVGA